jgi:hypothetical protein
MRKLSKVIMSCVAALVLQGGMAYAQSVEVYKNAN